MFPCWTTCGRQYEVFFPRIQWCRKVSDRRILLTTFAYFIVRTDKIFKISWNDWHVQKDFNIYVHSIDISDVTMSWYVTHLHHIPLLFHPAYHSRQLRFWKVEQYLLSRKKKKKYELIFIYLEEAQLGALSVYPNSRQNLFSHAILDYLWSILFIPSYFKMVYTS